MLHCLTLITLEISFTVHAYSSCGVFMGDKFGTLFFFFYVPLLELIY